MNTMENALLLGVLLLGLAGSALCSGLETGAYSANRVRLHLMEHAGDAGAKRLRRLLEKPTALLASLLVGNNIANYLQATALTVITSYWGFSDAGVIVFNVLIVTPIIFVFCETVPKDIFAAHADRLMPRLSPVLTAMVAVLRGVGVLPLIDWLGRRTAFSARTGDEALAQPRHQFELLVKEGVGDGMMSDEQSAIVDRVLDFADLRVGEEMTPWNKVVRVGIDEPPARLWRLAESSSISRFPATDAAGRVVGVVSLYDALRHTPETAPPIAKLVKPAPVFDHEITLREALARMRNDQSPIAIVTRNGRPAGIVTFKDLVEPITGELASW